MNQFFQIGALAIVLYSGQALSNASSQTAQSKDTVDCTAPTTQKKLNECAYEDFLSANEGYAESNKSVMGKLTGKQRELFRRSQIAWMAYRTAACNFESSALRGGSAQGMVLWQCTARMTRERVA